MTRLIVLALALVALVALTAPPTVLAWHAYAIPTSTCAGWSVRANVEPLTYVDRAGRTRSAVLRWEGDARTGTWAPGKSYAAGVLRVSWPDSPAADATPKSGKWYAGRPEGCQAPTVTPTAPATATQPPATPTARLTPTPTKEAPATWTATPQPSATSTNPPSTSTPSSSPSPQATATPTPTPADISTSTATVTSSSTPPSRSTPSSGGRRRPSPTPTPAPTQEPTPSNGIPVDEPTVSPTEHPPTPETPPVEATPEPTATASPESQQIVIPSGLPATGGGWMATPEPGPPAAEGDE